MEDFAAIAVLNELLAAEQHNLALRLFESTMFVSRLDVPAFDAVSAMACACRDNCATLTELILDLGGQPVTRTADPSTADLHFLEAHHVLPRLVADLQSLERKYALGAQRLAGEPRASALANRILDRHHRDLGQIQLLAARPMSAQRA